MVTGKKSNKLNDDKDILMFSLVTSDRNRVNTVLAKSVDTFGLHWHKLSRPDGTDTQSWLIICGEPKIK